MSDPALAPEWLHITPLGEFPNPGRGGVVQVVDSAAIDAILSRFNRERSTSSKAGLLLDYDHFSEDPNTSSEAAGWITDLQRMEDGGLRGRVRWTPKGARQVVDGSYRYTSAVFVDAQPLSANRFRVRGLGSVALTNKPNIPVNPILLNRRGASPQRSPAVAESFATALNRACSDCGEVFTALRHVRLANRAAYDSETPEERLDVLINRIKADISCNARRAFEFAEALAPELFRELDPNFSGGVGLRAEQARLATLTEFKACVLMNRSGIGFADAFREASQTPSTLPNRKGLVPDLSEWAERYGDRWAAMVDAEPRVLDALKWGADLSVGKGYAHERMWGHVNLPGLDGATAVKFLGHLTRYVEEVGSVEFAWRLAKIEIPQLLNDFLCCIVETELAGGRKLRLGRMSEEAGETNTAEGAAA